MVKKTFVQDKETAALAHRILGGALGLLQYEVASFKAGTGLRVHPMGIMVYNVDMNSNIQRTM